MNVFTAEHVQLYGEADFDFGDFGCEGEGIAHKCHCDNCGAEIEYFISTNLK